jgi:hypothetical protein
MEHFREKSNEHFARRSKSTLEVNMTPNDPRTTM